MGSGPEGVGGGIIIKIMISWLDMGLCRVQKWPRSLAISNKEVCMH